MAGPGTDIDFRFSELQPGALGRSLVFFSLNKAIKVKALI